MNSIHITINDIPPTNNKYIGRDNKWDYQAVKKQWAWLIAAAVKGQEPKEPYIKADVQLYYYFPDRRRRDPDNYSGKFVLDGLVKAGVLADDSFKCINLILRAGYDKSQPRTEITVREI